MDMNQPTIPPPEVGADPMAVHLWYIRRDMADIKKDQAEGTKVITDKIERIMDGFIGRTEFTEHLKADEDHEQRIRRQESFMDTLTGKIWGIGMIASLTVGIISFVLNHIFK